MKMMPIKPCCAAASAVGRPRARRSRWSQRGAAALAVAMVLLFVMTLILFFVNRGMLFEQKTSANQLRSTRAFEVAEAGLEWATALLNDPRTLDAACVPTAGQPASFRGLYAPAAGSPVDFAPPAAAQAGCRISAGVLVCSCPAPGTTPAPTGAAPTDPAFTVQIADEPGDPQAVRLTSWGCINQSAPCGPGGGGDAAATVHVTLKLRTLLRAMPPAALTTGGWAKVCGSFTLSNRNTAAEGILVNAGGKIQVGPDAMPLYHSDPGTTLAGAPTCTGGTPSLDGIPGTPAAGSMRAVDASLADIAASPDDMFAAFFGGTLAQFRAAPTTFTVSGGSAADRATALTNAYALGWRAFWVDGDISIAGSALGTPTDPVTLVSASDMSFSGTPIVHGLIYSDSADWNALGTGTMNVQGGVVSRLNFHNAGGGSIVYDPGILSRVRDLGVLVRVPGSWKDFP